MSEPLGLDDAIKLVWNEVRSTAPARFDSYRDNRDRSELDALARHAWNISLCQHLQPALHASELLLRNEVHRRLTTKYSDQWMFDTSLLRQDEQDRVAKVVHDIHTDKKSLTSDLVVSRLGFGFWVNLFNTPYETTVVRAILATGFKGLPPGRNRNRHFIRGQYATVLKLRNRAFHLEPIWNIPTLQDEFEVVWQTASWISRVYCSQARLHCSFQSVLNSGPRPFRDTLLKSIRDRVEKVNLHKGDF